MPRIAIALGFCFFVNYYVLCLLCVTRWEENMWRSSEFVGERWMMKNDYTDRTWIETNGPRSISQPLKVPLLSIYMRLC